MSSVSNRVDSACFSQEVGRDSWSYRVFVVFGWVGILNVRRRAQTTKQKYVVISDESVDGEYQFLVAIVGCASCREDLLTGMGSGGLYIVGLKKNGLRDLNVLTPLCRWNDNQISLVQACTQKTAKGVRLCGE